MAVAPGTPEFEEWRGLLFWIPAIAGGIFGLLGGYLTDRLGRRRVLTWSILIYAFSALAAGFSTNVWQFLFFRCTTFIGVCVEFVAAVAWLAELFTDRKQREKVLGYTQAFSSIGGALVTAANAWILVTRHVAAGDLRRARSLAIYADVRRDSCAAADHHPAVPAGVAGLAEEEGRGHASPAEPGRDFQSVAAPRHHRHHADVRDVATARRSAPFSRCRGIVPGTPEVATLAPARPLPADPAGARAWNAEAGRMKQQQAAGVQWWQEIGGLVGRTLLAMLIIVIASRRGLLRLFQVPGLIVVPLVFWFAPGSSVDTLKIGMFFAGLFTVAQFSFWGNYLPRVYPTHLRGTGEGFAANVGGRMLGTGFAYVTTTLAQKLAGAPHVRLATAAACCRRVRVRLRHRAQLLAAGAEERGSAGLRL